MTIRAGFIGLGNIGKPLAAHLAPAGYETTVFDVVAAPVQELVAAGARAGTSPRDVAVHADVIGICVPEDRHVRAVMTGDDGVLAGAARGTLVAIHSTILPSTAVELATLAAEQGVDVLDACVTGGDQRAQEGTVTYLVGGDPAVLERARPFLEASSVHIIHAGEIGSGAKLKLCINVVTYLQWAAAYEGFTLARASGLPVEVFEEAGKANGQLTELMLRYLGGHKLPPEVRASEDFQRYVRGYMLTAEKDLTWALELARSSGVRLPAAGLVSQMMAVLYGVNDPARR
jgi:3-hydroxyisobutyrate dehydrogenase